MARTRIVILWLVLLAAFLPLAFINAAPLAALSLAEGRSYDQAHDTGFIDWSGSASYVYITHRDGSYLPPEEGGTYCGSGCNEWVTRLGNGGVASGSFDRDVSYFEAMVGFSPNAGVGTVTLRACSAVDSWNLRSGGSLPGFVSMTLSVPAGCRSWSLSASGGYADFRSIDVYYIGPPSTATSAPSQTPTSTTTTTFTPTSTYTPTVTFTPTFTPTNTATLTPTFTPTFTPTNTPSPTPTPLPPEIIGQVVCDLWGDDLWCRGNETLELTSNDPQGFDVTINGDLNGIPFTCGSSCNLPLPEGVGTANYNVTSRSGRTANGSSTWQRDATSPVLDIVLPPLDGRNGWSVSEVEVSAAASDAISGLHSVAGSMDEGVTWTLFPIHIPDGVHPVTARAHDVAGNETLEFEVLHIDTVPPITQFTSHSNGELVQGNVLLSGKMVDATSGAAGGELSLDGTTWQAVSMGSGDTWSFTWQSNEVPNGQYTLLIRGYDLAGNIGDLASITLVVDNGPPSVSITERWWIWESGRLKVSPNHFPIASVKVTISDLQDRWPEVSLFFDPDKMHGVISWDRHFTDGAWAPSGEYRVIAVACDIHDLCASDTGIIVIPFAATSTTTATPSPTATFTVAPQATFTATQVPATPTPELAAPSQETSSEPTQPTRSMPIWQLLGLLGLFLAIASASLVDPRPSALNRLKESIDLILRHDHDDSSNNIK